MTTGAENRPHDVGKNRPHDGPKNRPDIINPVPLSGVITETGLRTLLVSKRQKRWCSSLRAKGLLILIDYTSRKMTGTGLTISADLARSFVSKLRKKIDPWDITEPLLLLCEIGILNVLRPAIFAHIKTSANYGFAAPYKGKRLALFVSLPPKLAAKRMFAEERKTKRLNRRYPFCERLQSDLKAISFAPSARSLIAGMLKGAAKDNVAALVSAVDSQTHSIKVSERGQITTTLGSCPRSLQAHLLLHGNPTISCDISHAHWNFLPKLIMDRLAYVSGQPGSEKYVAAAVRELHRLVGFLSEGDFYLKWCRNQQDMKEREEKKTVLNVLLNKPNHECRQNALYRWAQRTFPITFGIVEDLKEKDHRNLSKQLHRFTADVIETALLEVQGKAIAAIPLVDSLICEAQNRAAVCEVLGKPVFAMTGVRCRVGGIRYTPLTPTEAQALSYDECAPGIDHMTYDEWEEMRLVKSDAAHKLLRPLHWTALPFHCLGAIQLPPQAGFQTAANSCAA